jgi:hypothetical protein
MTAPGYFGRGLGAADLSHLEQILRDGLVAAYRRAMANAEQKALVRAKFPGLGEALADTRLSPVPVRHEVVPAVYDIDPRGVPLDHMVRFTQEVSARVGAVDPSLRYNYVSTSTALCRELFASSEGALIDQSFALTQGLCYAVAAGLDNSQEVYDVLGHQRGWEILEHGVHDGRHPIPILRGLRRRHRRGRGGAGGGAGPAHARSRGHRGNRPALQHPAVARDHRASRRARSRPQDGGGICRPLVASAWPRRSPGRQAGGIAARDGLLRSVAARLRALRLRPRGHPGPARRPHRSRRLPRVHEQPSDRGRVRR